MYSYIQYEALVKASVIIQHSKTFKFGNMFHCIVSKSTLANGYTPWIHSMASLRLLVIVCYFSNCLWVINEQAIQMRAFTNLSFY